jgi:hypothetical protein
MSEECRNKLNVADNNKTFCFTVTDWKTDGCRQTADRTGLDRREIMTDDRMITGDRLWGKVSGNNNW